jgi:hypothetical protein
MTISVDPFIYYRCNAVFYFCILAGLATTRAGAVPSIGRLFEHPKVAHQ